MIPRLGYEGDWADGEALSAVLAAAGLERPQPKAALFARAAAAIGGGSTAGTPGFFVPGRIEVLGKHTDYAGGRTMVAAAERGFCLVVRPGDDRRVRVVDALRGEEVAFELSAELAPPQGIWANYPMTAARRVARNFPDAARGATIALASDLPAASGMSSSSAFIVATFLALAEVNRLAESAAYRRNIAAPTDLAGYLGTVENGQTFGDLAGDRGVGTFGGSEDHTAILCARPGHISRYRYCPVRLEQLSAVPAGYLFALAVCGVAAEKTGAAMGQYNRASQLAAEVVQAWRRATGRDERRLADVLASSPDALARLQRAIADAGATSTSADLLRRLAHFVAENEEIVPAAGEALARGDVEGFGRLADRSQAAAETLLGNQIPQTSFLAAAARRLGAAAASAFGAGFGGSVWALVRRSEADAFLSAWAAAYRAEYPVEGARAEFLTTFAGPAAFRVR